MGTGIGTGSIMKTIEHVVRVVSGNINMEFEFRMILAVLKVNISLDHDYIQILAADETLYKLLKHFIPHQL